ncbi:aquaporin-3 isoform X2 [Ochotona curzoniae]|uniref:aquaporin-3 isoform X2 n=1 Tax=Ochotona curzoniae TaxID=130825 RepID=UPI001B35033B|nr:aquaporin-3 isoform X2 [Ochotona curzoniae]
MGRQKELVSRCGEMLHIRYRLLRQALAECLGTLILVMFGCGSVAQVVLSRGTHGGFLTINLAFGFAVTLGVLVAGQVSGAHLNPAVTFAMCFLAREPWIKLPVYTLAQTLGAFLGAGIVFGLYYDAILSFANNEFIVSGPNGTAGIFATYPSGHLDMVNGFFDQDWPALVVGTHRLAPAGLHRGRLCVPAHDRLPPGAAATPLHRGREREAGPHEAQGTDLRGQHPQPLPGASTDCAGATPWEPPP